jgi:hypothetical protein
LSAEKGRAVDAERVCALRRILLTPVAAVFSPNWKAVVEPVSAQFQVCGNTVEFIVLEAVPAVMADSAGVPDPPQPATPESVMTVGPLKLTQ